MKVSVPPSAPGFDPYEGRVERPELPTNVSVDDVTGEAAVRDRGGPSQDQVVARLMRRFGYGAG